VLNSENESSGFCLRRFLDLASVGVGFGKAKDICFDFALIYWTFGI
jgi:hypothetical protein